MTHTAMVPLGDIAVLQAGVGFPPELQGRTSGDYPLAKVGDISRVGRTGEAVINTADHFVDAIDLVRLKARPIPVGSVLFAKIGEAIRQNYRVIAGCELLVDNNAMAAIPTERVESQYLFHFLRTVDFYARAPATTVPALRKSDLQRLLVPLPPLPEQRRIAEILDKADALRAKRRAALAQLDTLTQSIFLSMFGDPKVNPNKWPERKLGELLKIEWGNTSITKDSYVPDGVPAYSATGCDGFLPEGEHDGEGIVLSAIGARCGKCFYVPGGSWTAIKNTITITLIQNSVVELQYVFPMVNDEGFWPNRGAGQPFITLGIARIQEIPVPPTELQRSFARRVGDVDTLRAVQRASLAELNTLFASLQHRAFRGEL